MAAPALPADIQKLRDQLVGDQAPSARTRTEFFDPAVFVSRHGRPYSSLKLPISTMKEMRTDALLRFAQLVSLVPIFTGKWRIECASARKAAFVDEALRRIIGRLIMQFYESWNFGWQAEVKQFGLMSPSWTFIDREAEGGAAARPVWDGGPGIPALVWEPFVPLRPESVTPVWTPGGAFNGIALSSTGTTGAYSIPTVPVASDDVIDAPPGINSFFTGDDERRKVDVDHCSPPDEMILTANRGPVQMGDLAEDDRLVVWDKKQKRMNRVRGYAFEKAVRPYSGPLLTISAGGSSTRVTSNHKVTVRWTAEAEEKKAVYLMRKGDWWRIGVAAVVTRKGGVRTSGIAHRVSAEAADAAWVLGIFDTKNEALYHERLWSCQYGIPDMVFQDVQAGRSEACLKTTQLETIWGQIDTAPGARELLADRSLDEDMPFYTHRPFENRAKTPRGPRGWTCAAGNLISGMMEVPVDVGRAEASWEVLEVEREHYEGDVVSIEVPPHHHYVSGSGVIVQNSLWVVNERDSQFGSIWGRSRLSYAYKYWYSYEMTLGILNRSVERKGDPTIVVTFPQGSSRVGTQDVPNQTIAFDIGNKARSGSVLVVPSEVWGEDTGTSNQSPKWGINYLKAEETFDKLISVLSYLDTMKIRSMMISELSAFEGSGGTSSRNVAAVTGERSYEAQIFTQTEWDEIINRYMIPQLADANFPELKDEPARKVTQAFGQDEAALAADILRSVANANSSNLPIDLPALLERFQIDALSGDDLAKWERDLVTKAETSTPPPAPASPNGAAGTTDTGFYYDAPNRIELSTDDALLASLPDTRHYRDRAVLAQTRAVRKVWFDLLTAQYNDFADHVSHVDLADDQARAEKIVGAWRYASAKTQAAVKKLSAALTTIFARAGAIELSASKIDPKVFDPSDEDMAAWVKDNVAAMVRSVEDTTRAQLTTRLTRGLERGDSADRIANDLRAHFAEFPDWRADLIAREETKHFYNAATLFAAAAAGTKQVQALDAQKGPTDAECERRNGRLFSITDAWKESAREHVRGTLGWRILPPNVQLSLHYFSREDTGGIAARIDPGESVIHLAEGLAADVEGEYLDQVISWFIATH